MVGYCLVCCSRLYYYFVCLFFNVNAALVMLGPRERACQRAIDRFLVRSSRYTRCGWGGFIPVLGKEPRHFSEFPPQKKGAQLAASDSWNSPSVWIIRSSRGSNLQPQHSKSHAQATISSSIMVRSSPAAVQVAADDGPIPVAANYFYSQNNRPEFHFKISGIEEPGCCPRL